MSTCRSSGPQSLRTKTKILRCKLRFHSLAHDKHSCKDTNTFNSKKLVHITKDVELSDHKNSRSHEVHELTHLPRADWCEHCQAALSREDAHTEVEPKQEVPIISLDWMFNRTGETESEEHPMTTQLVAVCHSTKYVVCVPVRSKAAEDNRPAVEEIVKMASILGYAKVALRGDTEPSMSL